MKSFNDIEKELTQDGIITDETLNLFREIDGMLSTGTMSWMINTCKKAIKEIEKGLIITYQNKELSKEEFRTLLNDNLSDFVIDRIYEKRR